MNALRIAALALLVAGALGLAYGGFSYTEETHDIKVGSLQLSLKEKRSVNIPMWAGAGAIVLGGLLFAIGRSRQ